MSGFVYIWYDRKHKRYYIGSHWGQEDDGYVCSSSWMKQAYRHRPQDFKRRVIARVNERTLLLDEEFRWLSMIKPEEIKVRYYNITTSVGHWHAQGYDKLKTTKERISAKTREAMARPEVREKYLEGLKTRQCWSEERRVRQSATMKTTMEKKFRGPDRDKYIGKKFWWTDGEKEIQSEKCPDGWRRGRCRMSIQRASASRNKQKL